MGSILIKYPKIIEKMLQWCDEGVLSVLSPSGIPLLSDVRFKVENSNKIRISLRKNSHLNKYIHEISYFTISADIVHPDVPTKNTGLMIEGLLDVNTNRFHDDYIDLNGKVDKIVAWRGPYFRRWRRKVRK